MKKFFIVLIMTLLTLNLSAVNDKVINKSLKSEQVADTTIQILRVKESKIDSPAKTKILLTQAQLDECYSDLSQSKDVYLQLMRATQDIIKVHIEDPQWPVQYYAQELSCYRKRAERQNIVVDKTDSSEVRDLAVSSAKAVTSHFGTPVQVDSSKTLYGFSGNQQESVGQQESSSVHQQEEVTPRERQDAPHHRQFDYGRALDEFNFWVEISMLVMSIVSMFTD